MNAATSGPDAQVIFCNAPGKFRSDNVELRLRNEPRSAPGLRWSAAVALVAAVIGAFPLVLLDLLSQGFFTLIEAGSQPQHSRRPGKNHECNSRSSR